MQMGNKMQGRKLNHKCGYRRELYRVSDISASPLNQGCCYPNDIFVSMHNCWSQDLKGQNYALIKVFSSEHHNFFENRRIKIKIEQICLELLLRHFSFFK